MRGVSDELRWAGCRRGVRLGLGLAFLTWLAAGWMAGAVAAPAAEMNAALDPGGRTFTISLHEMGSFRSGFAAEVGLGGRDVKLSSAAGTVIGPAGHSTEATPFGRAEVMESTIRFQQEQVDLLFRLGRAPGVPGILLQAGIRNAGQAPLKLTTLTALATEDAGPIGQVARVGNGLQPAGRPEDWLITGWHASKLQIVALNEITTPLMVREAGGFFRGDGVGFLFGPVGTSTAYGAARFTPLQQGRMGFSLTADMSGAQVRPGEMRWGQQMVLLMDKPERAMARWAEWVGNTHGARTSKGALSGWNSWNFRTQKTTDSELLKVTDTIERSGGRLRPGVIQIDDAVEPARAALDAPWRAPVADRVRKAGARFGLRLNVDRTPSADDPAGLDPAISTIRRAVQCGFTYLKISCPRAAERVPDEKRTSLEIYRDDWAAIRRAAGEDAYLLYAGGGDLPDRATVGHVDASRVASDATRRDLRKVIAEILPSFALQNRWFTVDPDVFYMAGEIEDVCSVEGGAPVMQTWLSMVGLSCGAAITSEPFYWKAFDPYSRNMEVLSPPARERTDVLHLFTMPSWTALVGHVRREWGESTVALLFNAISSSEFALPAHFDFVQAGLDPGRRYAVWSFWDNQFLGIAQGKWALPVLPNGHSQHLVFTDLDRTPDRPVLIGSNLHIYCGAGEIKQVTSSRDAMRIDLTDAGARAGDLFVYSRWPLLFKSAAGCAVSGVVKVGENAWRIGIADRQRDAPQQLELAVLLPVTRQAWFWLLIATAAASLLLAAWRYVAGLQLQREHVLDQERARIARDLHDDLGANLAEIAMISDLAQDKLTANDPSREHFNDIFARAENNVRRLGEIVWAINPANDTLERFAGYLCKFTQDYLALARIRCRLDLPETLPPVPLNSVQRHNLLLAAKEAIHNAVQHGRPAEINLRIATRNGHIIVTIEDNGRGFDTTRPVAHGRGSANMAARMEQIGGGFERRSASGQGTIVTLTAPFTTHKR